MLLELTIQNFAIIERLLVRFDPGLTVLTGETGAGKSIIIDALQASLGARVAADTVRAGERLAAVEAVFEVVDPAADRLLQALLFEQGIDAEDTLILRREISAAGRSTARINGRAVPLSVLAAAGARLVDIHGQSDHLSVLRRDRQLEAIDRYGDLLPLREQVAARIREYNHGRRELNALVSGQREAEQRLDLLRFQVEEIESAGLIPGEDDDLNAERNRLANAERLIQLAETVYERLQGDQSSTLDSILAAQTASHDLASIDPELAPVSERLTTARLELEDIAQEMRQYRDRAEYDPKRLDEVESRLDLLTRLRRKYGATVEDVIAFGFEARASLEAVENLDDRIEALRERVRTEAEEAGRAALELSLARETAARALTDAMKDALLGLGLKGTGFEAKISQAESDDGLLLPGRARGYAFSSTGVDEAAFLVSFNPGEPLRPIDKVASGGETSRFLLALKSVLASADQTPTLVFDEIDVGVGARHGMVVGERLMSLARGHQVLSITHLPQIAALADQHLTVAKHVVQGKTGVVVRSLQGSERVAEIAEMMSGTGSETARRTAEELLEAAQDRH